MRKPVIFLRHDTPPLPSVKANARAVGSLARAAKVCYALFAATHRNRIPFRGTIVAISASPISAVRLKFNLVSLYPGKELCQANLRLAQNWCFFNLNKFWILLKLSGLLWPGVCHDNVKCFVFRMVLVFTHEFTGGFSPLDGIVLKYHQGFGGRKSEVFSGVG
ncbi:hypothetical protein [Anaerolinea thermolimosa]|uniref:hypothetical protein n=1 Tax=Anaerolinea thermolimosa TaxID=229919 RepID=UPI0013B3BE03|nr:hypothetical protein [Anaerolinea thermolimosa]